MIIMSKIAFVTDSGTGLSVKENAADGIFSVPLQLTLGDKSYREFEEAGYEQVYQQLHANKIVKTSLPLLSDIEELFASLKADGYTEIFAVPICPGLSGTANAMNVAAQSLDMKFTFFDSGTTALIQRYLIRLAKRLSDEGVSTDEIIAKLEEITEDTNTILIPNDLMHMARGGRLSTTSAVVGNLIKIKPILEVNKKTSGKVDVVKKLRTFKRSLAYVFDEMLTTLKTNQSDYHVVIAHVDVYELGQDVMNQIKEVFPQVSTELIDLIPTVSAHTGLGCIGLQYFRKN